MTKTTILDPKLREFGNDVQQKHFDAYLEHGSYLKAARALGFKSKNAVQDSIARLIRLAARQGYAPGHFESGVAPGFNMGKVTVQRGPGGEVERTWERQSPDQEQAQEMMRAAVAAMSEPVRGLAPLIKAPAKADSDLLAVFPVGDPHVGLYVWAKECGDAFDLDIARALTFGAVDRLMASAPAAETAIILLLGDVFHMNDQTNATPGHKHQLDVDSRFVKVLQVGIETYRHTIIRALQKYPQVIFKAIPGNHDPQAVWALAMTISAYFSNEPRVMVDLNPSKFWFYRFGKVLIGSTHGDTVKHESLPGIMACDRPEDWGATRHRHWYTGHVHSQHVREFPGVVCESFRTLAAKDSYAAGHGYRAGRDMVCIVHHREHGEVERHRCDVGMLATA
jgi:hypothetical protein